MFKKLGKWTDQHGVEHTDAVFQMAHANFSADISTSDSFVFDVSNGFAAAVPQATKHDPQENNNLNYKVYYWANQAAKDAGSMPFTLMKNDGGGFSDAIHAFGLGVEYEGLTAEEKAEKHCQETILV